MAFLRFLNKKKESVKEELDVPPMPPPSADFPEENLESLGGELPELPPLPEKGEAFKITGIENLDIGKV